MGEHRTALILLLILVSPAISITEFKIAKAESRTLVVPDDYPTIKAAIENAMDGDTIFVNKGIYEENPLEINKTLSLMGEGADSTKISFDPPYTEVTISIYEHYIFYDEPIKVFADGFKMSGFTIDTTGGDVVINGNGTKITENQILTDLYVLGSHLSVTENKFPYSVTIRGSNSKISANIGYSFWICGSFFDISFNNISGSDSATRIHFEGNFSLIHDNTIKKAPYGRFSVAGNENIVCRNIVDDAAFGLALSGSNNTVYANRITNSGIGLENPESSNFVYANYVASNGWGINTGYNSTTATLYHNNFISNRYQVSTIFSSYPTQYFDNGAEGNYWSDYNGKDANGDGIGDTPYVIDANRSDRYPLMVPFDIDSVTVELPEWAPPPDVRLISPENMTYNSGNVALNFTVNEETSWMGYSLDGQDNVTITETTLNLTELADGSHTLKVYAIDTDGNTGASETIRFTIAKESETEQPDQLNLILASALICIPIATGLGLLIYLKERK